MVNDQTSAIPASYTLGNWLILENEKRLLRRKSYDPVANQHIFWDVMLGGEISIVEFSLSKAESAVKNATDRILAMYLLTVDTSRGLPPGRTLVGDIKVFNDITYGSATYTKDGRNRLFSIVVYHGKSLLVVGNIGTVVAHLQPPAQKGLLDRIKLLFGSKS